jgi:hypothetical protein
MDQLIKEPVEIKLPSGKYEQGGRVQTQQSMESQHQFIEALQHTWIRKMPVR